MAEHGDDAGRAGAPPACGGRPEVELRNMPKGYVILTEAVKDPSGMAAYGRAAAPTMAQSGGADRGTDLAQRLWTARRRAGRHGGRRHRRTHPSDVADRDHRFWHGARPASFSAARCIRRITPRCRPTRDGR